MTFIDFMILRDSCPALVSYVALFRSVAHVVPPEVPPRLPTRPELRRLLGGVGQPRADADREALGRLSRALGREPQAYHRRVGWRGEPSAFRPPGAGSSFSRSQGSRHAGLERFTFAGMLLVRGAVCLPPRK